MIRLQYRANKRYNTVAHSFIVNELIEMHKSATMAEREGQMEQNIAKHGYRIYSNISPGASIFRLLSRGGFY